MKLNNYIKAVAGIALAATFFAGCKFDGTTASFKDEERNAYTVENNTIANAATIVGFTGANGVALSAVDSKTEIQVEIKSQGRLDEKSVEAALDVYPLTVNTTDSHFAPSRGTAFAKTLKRIDVDETAYPSTDFIKTTVIFFVDLSTVTKDYVAIMADATKLKEKTGKLILNYDNNEKCGEESDSVVEYIEIASVKKDDTTEATEALGWVKSSNNALDGHIDNSTYFYENWAPTFSLYPSISAEVKDGKATGALKLTVSTYGIPKADSASNIRKEGFAGDIGNIYSLRVLPIGAKSWTEEKVTFAPDEGDPSPQYVALSNALTYGTKYQLSTKANNSLVWEAATVAYGHTPRISWKKNKNSYSGVSTYTYFLESPAYIVNTPNNVTDPSTDPYTPISKTVADIKTTQSGLISKDVHNGDGYVIFTISTANKVRFGEIADFVITDDKYTKIKTKAPVAYAEDSDGVYKVIVELENKNLDMTNFKYWVGEGTTILANKQYPSQTKFGTPKVEGQNLLAGYVQL